MVVCTYVRLTTFSEFPFPFPFPLSMFSICPNTMMSLAITLLESATNLTPEGIEQWTPVVRKKKKIKQQVCEKTDSESSGSEVDVSCSRLVEYQKKDGVPGLNIISIEKDLLCGHPLLSGLARSRTSRT